MKGVDLMTIKELLGHKDITMTMRHTHLSPDHKRLAVQKLESAYKAEKKIIELPVAEK
jgi:site-specific recombinase XerD